MQATQPLSVGQSSEIYCSPTESALGTKSRLVGTSRCQAPW